MRDMNIVEDSIRNMNVYDLRREKSLYHILDAKKEIECVLPNNVAMVISLYYFEEISRFQKYIDLIQEEIDVYVVSPNEKLLSFIKSESKRSVRTIVKKNRGRDISAFLVAARDVFKKYRYVGFVHDKKEKFDEQKVDSEFWIYNMWENTLASKSYISQILNLFENDNDLGLLLPPEPVGEYINCWYFNKWSSNFENTVSLCRRIGTKAVIDSDVPPISFGTVFWCRTKALRKLIDYEWKYEDFKAEPLPIDGEINHAIERALPYIAQDAGYSTHIVMTIDYAQRLMAQSQFIAQRAFGVLNSELGIRYAHELNNFNDKKKELREFCAKYSELYLYGIGERAKDVLKLLRLWEMKPNGYIVTNKTVSTFEGCLVYSLEEWIEMKLNKDYGIVVATNHINAEEIKKMLDREQIRNYYIFSG